MSSLSGRRSLLPAKTVVSAACLHTLLRCEAVWTWLDVGLCATAPILLPACALYRTFVPRRHLFHFSAHATHSQVVHCT